MPPDIDVVTERLRRLERCVRKLTEVRDESEDAFVSDEDLQDKAERNFQIAAQSCIDIGSHLVAADDLGVPESYADIFYLLSDAGIMPRPFADKMANLAGFRNLLVHDYTKVKPAKVYANLKRLDDFHDFARYITAYLERQSP